MDLEQAIAGRRSMRDYTEAAADEVVIGRLIETAIHSNAALTARWITTGNRYRMPAVDQRRPK